MIIAAVPFRGGCLLAAPAGPGLAGSSILKGRQGLLTGTQPSLFPVVLPSLQAALGEAELGLSLAGLQGCWFFTWEIETAPPSTFLGEPVGLFRSEGSGSRRIYRVSLAATSDVPGAVRAEAELRLSGEENARAGFEERLVSLLTAFTWLRERLPQLPEEWEVGVHEGGLHYSVDRVALGG